MEGPFPASVHLCCAQLIAPESLTRTHTWAPLFLPVWPLSLSFPSLCSSALLSCSPALRSGRKISIARNGARISTKTNKTSIWPPFCCTEGTLRVQWKSNGATRARVSERVRSATGRQSAARPEQWGQFAAFGARNGMKIGPTQAECKMQNCPLLRPYEPNGKVSSRGPNRPQSRGPLGDLRRLNGGSMEAQWRHTGGAKRE